MSTAPPTRATRRRKPGGVIGQFPNLMRGDDVGEFVQPHLVKLRCVSPQNHWDPCVGIGHESVQHDADGCILVPRGPHANALLAKGGYVICED
jgi:hypothetical protein